MPSGKVGKLDNHAVKSKAFFAFFSTILQIIPSGLTNYDPEKGPPYSPAA